MPQLERVVLPKNIFMINYFGKGVLLQRNKDDSITMFKPEPQPVMTEGSVTKEDVKVLEKAMTLKKKGKS